MENIFKRYYEKTLFSTICINETILNSSTKLIIFKD